MTFDAPSRTATGCVRLSSRLSGIGAWLSSRPVGAGGCLRRGSGLERTLMGFARCVTCGGGASPVAVHGPLHRSTRLRVASRPSDVGASGSGDALPGVGQRTRRCGGVRAGVRGRRLQPRLVGLPRARVGPARPPPHAAPAVSHGFSGSFRVSRCGRVASRCRSWGSRSFRARRAACVAPGEINLRLRHLLRCGRVLCAPSRPSEPSPCSQTSTVVPRSRAGRGVAAGPHAPVVRRRRCDAVLSGFHGQACPLVVSHAAASSCCTHPPCRVWAAGVCCRVPRPQGVPPRADPLRRCRVATTPTPDAPLGLSVLQLRPSRGLAARPPGGDCSCAISMGRAVLPGPVRRGVRCPNRGGRGHSSRGCGRTGRPLRRAGPGPRSPSGAQRTVFVTSKSGRDARRASR